MRSQPPLESLLLEDEGRARPRARDRQCGATDRALALAYRYLSRRERTTVETRTHLLEKGVTAERVEAAIGALQEQGYLDDARFAQLFVQDKRTLEQWGSERIGRALRERGVARELIDAAIAEGPLLDRDEGEESELDRALALLRRRFATPPRDRRERDRAIGVLMRKGYDQEVVLEALASYAREPA
jgi:regulatory protein